MTILIPFIIFAMVYGIGSYPIFEKKDVLLYYATIGGACITTIGLCITLYQNAKSLEEQRNIDKNAREEEKERFNNDYKIKLIKQKLNDYKEIYILLNEIVTTANDITNKLAINTTEEDLNKHLQDIQKLFYLANKYSFMQIYITEKNILELTTKAEIIIDKLTEKLNKLPTKDLLLLLKDNSQSKKEYMQYYIDVNNAYLEISTKLATASKKIYMDNMVII